MMDKLVSIYDIHLHTKTLGVDLPLRLLDRAGSAEDDRTMLEVGCCWGVLKVAVVDSAVADLGRLRGCETSMLVWS